MAGPVEQLQSIAASFPDSVEHDDAVRLPAITAAKQIISKCERPFEIAGRVAWGPLDCVLAKIAQDLDIFGQVTNADGDVTFDQLQQTTKADPVLLQRILRYLTSHDMLDLKSSKTYGPNKATKTLSSRGNKGQVALIINANWPAWGALPDFLKQTGYKNPEDPKATAWQTGWKTDDQFFEWLVKRPDVMQSFHDLMQEPRPRSKLGFADHFPAERFFEGSKADDVLFVDIGGSTGHQCMELRQTYGAERGRIVLQDLPEVIANADVKDIEAMPHDMMQEQPVKSARAYYLRAICHDHADSVCRGFLGRVAEAMGPDSVCLVDDCVVPEAVQSPFTTRLDIGMMSQLAGVERSPEQWQDLLGSVGLKIKDMHEYGPDKAIIEAVKA